MDDTGYSKLKQYVDVEVRFDKYGRMIPSAITWEDGTTYPIDRLLDMRSSFSAKAGGRGDLYLVQIHGTACHLFFERNPYQSSGSVGRWFVSRNVS